MAFWSKERLEREQSIRPLVAPFDPSCIEQNAYALGVASEYAITSTDDGGNKRTVALGENIKIPPGQFALLLTVEEISIPSNAMAFISMKAKLKLRGLINVSGFHVDPGFHGRLKFAVYNSGAGAIDLEPGQRLFLVWYCDLDQSTTSLYSGGHQGQVGITTEDVMNIRGITASPAGLKSQVDKFEEQVQFEIRRLEAKIDSHQSWSRPILAGITVAVVVFLLGVYVKPILDSAIAPRFSTPYSKAPSPASVTGHAGGSTRP